MASRSRQAGVERVAHLLIRLLRGGEVSTRDFRPEIGEGLLWTPSSGTSLTEALILAGPPLVPSHGDARRIVELWGEGLIRPLAQRPGDPGLTSPLRDIVLFSLAWMLLNRVDWGEGIPVDEMRSLYLEYMRSYSSRWGSRYREAFDLMTLGFEPLLSDRTLDALVELVLQPLGMGGTAKGFLPGVRVPEEIASKMIRLREGLPVHLPVPKSEAENLELLRLAREVGEIYGEVRVSILLVLRRMVAGRLPGALSLGEVLDQLSNELRDWSRRRRFSLLGAKIRRRIIRFRALYPSAPDAWLRRMGEGVMERVGGPSTASSVPWPFRERGVAFLSAERGDQVTGAS